MSENILNRLKFLVCTGFYTGLSPVAPGTVCSLFLGAAVHLLLVRTYPPLVSLSIMISILLLTAFLTHIFTPWARSYWREDDSPKFVLDEVSGYFLAPILTYPLWDKIGSLTLIICCFLGFRFFDITKIFPANWIDKNFKNSFGILFDDYVASCYTSILIYFYTTSYMR